MHQIENFSRSAFPHAPQALGQPANTDGGMYAAAAAADAAEAEPGYALVAAPEQ